MVSKGFSLVEIIIAVAIVAMISVVALLGFGQQQAKARDARRIADVGSVGIAIESYRTDIGSYPYYVSPTQPQSDYVYRMQVLVDKGLINTLPHDPKPVSDPDPSHYFCNDYVYQTPIQTNNNPPTYRWWYIQFRAELDAVNGHSPLDATIDSNTSQSVRCTGTSSGGFNLFYGAVMQ